MEGSLLITNWEGCGMEKPWLDSLLQNLAGWTEENQVMYLVFLDFRAGYLPNKLVGIKKTRINFGYKEEATVGGQRKLYDVPRC
jgi:hypothetical protein